MADLTIMTHSAADVALQAMLNGAQVTAYPNDWTGSVNSEPDDPDRAVTLYDQQGQQGDRDGLTGAYAERFGLQVRVRSRTSVEGMYKAKQLRAFMLRWYGGNVTIAANSHSGVPAATYKLHAFVNVGDVLGIGREPQTGREINTINALVVCHQL